MKGFGRLRAGWVLSVRSGRIDSAAARYWSAHNKYDDELLSYLDQEVGCESQRSRSEAGTEVVDSSCGSLDRETVEAVDVDSHCGPEQPKRRVVALLEPLAKKPHYLAVSHSDQATVPVRPRS
jgi:hypothetical protein